MLDFPIEQLVWQKNHNIDWDDAGEKFKNYLADIRDMFGATWKLVRILLVCTNSVIVDQRALEPNLMVDFDGIDTSDNEGPVQWAKQLFHRR